MPGNWLTINNTVQLNNYKEELVINSGVGDHIANIKIKGRGKLKVYDNTVLLYQGDFNGFTVPSTINSSHNYRITSNQPISASYDVAYSTGIIAPVCENCQSKISSGNVNGQDYHYFCLPQGGMLSISGGGITINDVVSNTDLYINQSSAVTLPAGMYKAIVQTGDPQLSYSTSWGDISMVYYDQQGHVIASIAPKGVQQILANGVTSYADLAHLPFTNTMEYNKSGHLMASNSTDGGRSEFIYRRDGKIRFSQNAEQRTTGRFSYTNYDDSGLPVESGEYVPGDVSFSSAKTDQALQENINSDGGLTGGTKQDWVRTHYNLADNSHGQSGYVQDYLDGAVSWTENANAKTWYSYDEQGKVTWVIKYVNGLGYKTIDYIYDYLGKVTTIAYQKNTPAERFYHHYTYDADQRLVNVQTSRDGVNKLQQANYQYYLHGPIKRVELGENTQGIDYVYTAQGMLKSINHASGDPLKDPGHDGQNSFAADAFSMQLEYFNGDYNRNNSQIGSISTGQSYYNGNVTALGWQSNKPQSVLGSVPPGIQAPAMYKYDYDTKNQLKQASWGTPNYISNTYTPANSFSETVVNSNDPNNSYDANGNILGIKRTNGGGAIVDDFTNYQYQAGTNQLNAVGNAANPAAYGTYTYDALGQLKIMQKTGESFTYNIKYDVTGKITGIYADAAFTQLKISYGYDENGKRISRTDYTRSVPETTYYVYDSGGNNLAIYTGTTLTEMPFYGSDRLGSYTLSSGNYVYELRDNVGSVRIVVNRNKNSDGGANIMTYNDYYPFGSIAQSGGTGYRYDYQGAFAEKDPITGFNNFELRMYDGRIGRWLSTDPAGQYASPYEGMGNNPVTGSDPTGGETTDFYKNLTTGQTTWIDGSADIAGYQHLGGADYTFGGYALNEVNITAKSLGIGQPSFGTSLIPVYGSARSSIDYFQRGKWGMGTFQAAMAVSDLFLVKSLATAGVKLGAGLIGKFAAEGAGELAAKEGTTVFRAVDATEESIIKSSGQFSLQQGGVESKYFAKSAEDAHWYGAKLYPNGYKVIQGTVNAPINAAEHWFPHVDIGAYVFPGEALPHIIPH